MRCGVRCAVVGSPTHIVDEHDIARRPKDALRHLVSRVPVSHELHETLVQRLGLCGALRVCVSTRRSRLVPTSS